MNWIARKFNALGALGYINWMPDRLYLQILFRLRMGHKLNLVNPQTYSEKLQWLKLYDRKPLYTQLVDKYAVREHVAKTISEAYLVPLVGGPWNSFDEIDFDVLPEQFVLKCTHDSGGLVICQNKSNLDREVARQKIGECLRCNFFWSTREWPYKNVPPRIIAEQYLKDEATQELRDYKFFVFNGNVKALFIASNRQTAGIETGFDFFDENFEHLDLRNGHPNANPWPSQPGGFALMKELASRLSEGLAQARIDFYEVNGRIYFGEITFFHWSGMMPFEPEEWDWHFGDWVQLPRT